MQLLEIAKMIDGSCNCTSEIDIKCICSLENPKEDCIIVVFDKKKIKEIQCLNVKAVVCVNSDIEINKPCIFVNDPKRAFIKLLNIFNSYD